MKEIKVGLIKGRHEMPVENYIFEKIDNVFDFDYAEKVVKDFVLQNCDVKAEIGCAINQADFEDVKVWQTNTRLYVYITGLAYITAALIKVCAKYGASLSLMHFDTTSQQYVEQYIF